jgi:drug/metabolite transporter (DMT)-like permease
MDPLKNALLGNAVFSAVSGAALLTFHTKIAHIFGFEDGIVFGAIGAALLFFAATVWYESRRLRPPFVRWIVVQDVLWVLGSVFLLVFRPFAISGTGSFLVAAVAVVVAFFGWRQWVGLGESDYPAKD